MQYKAHCRIQITSEEKDLVKSVGSWNLEGSSTLCKLGFEGLFDILVLQLYLLVDHFGLEGHREVFMPSTLVFLFDNTSWCYLVFASLFPYFLCFTFIVYCICLCTRE